MDGFFLSIVPIMVLLACATSKHATAGALRFNNNGEFKILQVADMHFADGASTKCLDVLPEQLESCSDLNTTDFMRRMIQEEKPDLIVFTGDNIYQLDSSNATASLIAAFAPAVNAKVPWAAVLGNHDQEGTMSRSEVMAFIVQMGSTLSQMNPDFPIGDQKTVDGFGNYILEVAGAAGSAFENKSVLNLYMIDSGDYSAVPEVSYYDWIKSSQQVWLQQTSARLQKEYTQERGPHSDAGVAPALAFHHIPIPESFNNDTSILGEKGEESGSADVNSGFLSTLISMGDVQAAFTGHDHLNDYCGETAGVFLCYSGGFGYHAYGRAGWPRRSRVITTYLSGGAGNWKDVKSIQTWKRLDDVSFSKIDDQILYTNSGSPKKTHLGKEKK